MRKRGNKKLWRDQERLKAYGLLRSRGSKKLRRARRTILARNPHLRDWQSLPIDQCLDLLEACLERYEQR